MRILGFAAVMWLGLASHAAAQSLGALSLGESEASAVRKLGVAEAKPVTGSNVRIAFNGTTMVEICSGKVTGIQEQIGGTFHDFAASVVIETERQGKPTYFVNNARTSAGEMSWQDVSWNLRDHTLIIGIFMQGSDSLKVARTIRSVDCR